MLVYRVFFHDSGARPGDPGHALHLHRPQGAGRWDNPDLYDAWYFARSPEGAIGEVFDTFAEWHASMFDTGMPGLRRAMAVFSVPDDLAVFNFDDAANLQRIGMRPSDVVIRNKSMTQRRAVTLFKERNADGSHRWQGLQWWSYHHPQWTNLMLWGTRDSPAPLTLRRVEKLELTNIAVEEAARTLMRSLGPVGAP